MTAAQAASSAFRLERELLGRPVGQQDGWAAALGGAVRMSIAPDGEARARRSAELHEALVVLADNGLMLCRTGRSRDAGQVLAKARAVTRADYESALAAAERAERAFLSRDATVVGAMLREHWARKVSANPAADHPVCRRIEAGGRDAGIHGFKLIGAGGGGHLLVAASSDRAARFLDDLGLTRIPLRLTESGLNCEKRDSACASA
jgi:D-glycero-alpha-D-manno-heptose-7-phosphate kinase